MGTRAQWKNAEMRLARFFGTVRRPLSGGNQTGAKEGPRDDGQHDILYIENKYGAKVAPWSLYKDTLIKAKHEGRTPVMGLQQKGETGMLICFNSRDMETVCTEWAKANGFFLCPSVQTLKPNDPDVTVKKFGRKKPIRKKR